MPARVTYPGVYIEEIPNGTHPVTAVSTSTAAFVGYFSRGPMNKAVLVNSMREFNALLGGLDVLSEAGYGILQFFTNGGKSAWVVRVAKGSAGARGTSPSYACSNANIPVATPDSDSRITVYAASPGVWGNSVQVAFQNAESTPEAPDAPTRFNLYVQEVAVSSGDKARILTTERYLNLSLDPSDAQYAVATVNRASQLISLGDDPEDQDDAYQPPALDTQSAAPEVPAVPEPGNMAATGKPPVAANWTSLTGGSDGLRPGREDLVPYELQRNGMYSLADLPPSAFNILCIPALAPYLEPDGPPADELVSAFVFCEKNRALMIVDIPPGLQKTDDMVSWMSVYGNARAYRGAVYFPRLLIADPLADLKPRNVGPSGTLAGVYARTDANEGIWKAPAGTDVVLEGADLVPLVTPSGPQHPTDQDSDRLNPLGCNVLRSFPVHGNVSWGARTMAGSDALGSEWKYISLRRLTDFLEASLFQSTEWVVFEPNDESTWSQIRAEIGSFLARLFAEGAFVGVMSEQAFFVKCDCTTTTSADIAKGIVNIVVGFAPLRPAEFIILKIAQRARQSAG